MKTNPVYWRDAQVCAPYKPLNSAIFAQGGAHLGVPFDRFVFSLDFVF